MKTNIHLRLYLLQFFLEREIFHTNVVEIPKTYILCSVIFFKRAVYDLRWKNIVEPDRPQMTIWRIRIACWIPNVTNTISEYVIPIAFPLQQWFNEWFSVLSYTYNVCLVFHLQYSFFHQCCLPLDPVARGGRTIPHSIFILTAIKIYFSFCKCSAICPLTLWMFIFKTKI